MIELWCVRHGQTDWNVEGRWQGQSDVPLNAVGLAQAETLAARLSGQRFAALYSSDLSRARQTAEHIAAQVNLPVRLDPRLREISHGEWEGLLVSEINRRRAEQPAMRAPGGEAVQAVAERLTLALDDIAAAWPGERVLVVSHGFCLAVMICLVNGIPLKEAGEHIPANATPVVLSWPAGEINPA